VLTKDQKDDIIKLIQEGVELPEEYKYQLFPTKQKEYELAYAGKMRKEDILACADGVYPVPLQVEKVFNGNEYEAFEDDWKNMIVFGDNLQFLKTILKDEDPLIKDKIKGKVKLIYIDPPFATTDEFQNKEGAKAYNDKKKGAEFVDFLRKRLILAREILADDGNILIHLDYRKSHYIKVLLDEIFGENSFVNEIIWQSTDPKNNVKTSLGNIHQTIYWYSRNKERKNFNTLKTEHSESARNEYSNILKEDEIIKDGEIIKSKAKVRNNIAKFKLENTTAPKYSKNRVFEWYGYTPKKGWRYDKNTLDEMLSNGLILLKNRKASSRCQVKYLDNLDGIPLQTIWQDVGTMKSGSGTYPTEKPEKLLKRIVESFSNKNEIIMDFFGGSGTAMAVAEKLGRKWITCDLGKLSYFTMQKRILQIQESKDLEDPKKKYDKKAKSFITASLGSYDLEKTFALERKKYLEFVSGLFEIELKKHTVSGFEFDGKKDNYPVIIYDYNIYKDSSIDENYLQDIHRNIGKKVGSRVYIITPINFVDFVDDFIEIDDVRYYFLKIPYHIINELHEKPFVKVRQPQSKSRVNDIEEAIGFHFKRPPEVKAELKNEKNEIKIIIKSFKTTELQSDKTSEEKSYDNFETLSSVFVDKTYNGKSFEMDEAFFADELLPKKKDKQKVKINEDENIETDENISEELKELSKTGIEISLKKSEIGDQVMIICTDIYGNDFTQTFKI